ncbi:unnamed protein product [Mytilus coruscus]|uniref:Uncharacterized protein n=1 Tax=Mytilus coruscus TaxID=42192 RepID=A0A6J8BNV5_MYTCO|nr:unnamed protein product [Mytilus coruscus]
MKYIFVCVLCLLLTNNLVKSADLDDVGNEDINVIPPNNEDPVAVDSGLHSYDGSSNVLRVVNKIDFSTGNNCFDDVDYIFKAQVLDNQRASDVGSSPVSISHDNAFLSDRTYSTRETTLTNDVHEERTKNQTSFRCPVENSDNLNFNCKVPCADMPDITNLSDARASSYPLPDDTT